MRATPAGVRIRPAERGDLAAVLHLWSHLDAHQARLDPTLAPVEEAVVLWTAEFKSILGDESVCVRVAETQGAVVGLVTAHVAVPRPLYASEPFVFIDEIVVDPAWRQRGIAGQLVEEVRHWARGLGLARIEARMVAASVEARAFWRRVGGNEVAVTVRLGTAPGAPA